MPVGNLVRFVEVSYSGEGTFNLKTNVPGPSMAIAGTVALPAVAVRTTRRWTLPGNCRAIEIQANFVPGAGVDLGVLTCRLWAKALGMGVTAWRWVPLPIPPAPEEWSTIRFSIPQAPEEWSKISFQIPPTPEEWSKIPLVNGKTSDWQWIDVPGGEA